MRMSPRWFVSCAVCLAVVLTLVLNWQAQQQHRCYKISASDTLVVHIFADTDPQYLENLKFFVRHGMTPADTAEYIIVVQTVEAFAVSTSSAVYCGRSTSQ